MDALKDEIVMRLVETTAKIDFRGGGNSQERVDLLEAIATVANYASTSQVLVAAGIGTHADAFRVFDELDKLLEMLMKMDGIKDRVE